MERTEEKTRGTKRPEKPGRISVQNEAGRYFLSGDAHNRVFWRKALDCSQRNMEELLHIERFPEELRKYFSEKPLLIFSLRHFENPQWFHTDLRQVCEILRRTKDKIQLQNYIKENQKVFSSLPEDTYNLLTVMMGIRQLEQIKENVRTEKGDFDMCKAFDDMMADSERRGEKRGENLMGRLINELIQTGRIDDLMTAAGNPDYCQQLMMEFGIK